MKSPFLAVLTLLGSPAAFAFPQLSPKCAEMTNLNHVANSSGVYFSEDCKTVYVMPPAKGTVVLDSLAPSFMLSQCAPFESALHIIEQNYLRADEVLKDYWKPANKNARPRSPLSPGGPLNGGPLTGNRGQQNDTSNTDAEDARRAKLMTQYREAMALAQESLGYLEPFKSVEAATGQMIFTANWQKLVDEYQKANPGFHFERLNMSNQILSYSRKMVTESINMPAAFKVQIPGVNAITLDGSPSGNEANIIFGEAISGQITLSLAGACPYYNASTKKMRSRIAGNDLSAHFTANVQFEFNLQTKRKYAAEYHLGQLVKRIQESGSRGGFFSSSSYSKLLIEKSSDDWFKFTAEDEDPRFAYDIDGLRASVKADLINRVTRTIVEMNGGDPTSVPAPAPPGTNGAAQSSAALKKCPNQYCQLGAMALDILNATFGSSSTNSTFINQNNYWAKENSDERKALPFTGSYTFVGGQ